MERGRRMRSAHPAGTAIAEIAIHTPASRAGPMTGQSLICEFTAEVSRDLGLNFAQFEDLYRWSVDRPADFWEALWRFDGIMSRTPYSQILTEDPMPGTRWFVGAEVNYALQVFRHATAGTSAGQPAIIAEDEQGSVLSLDWSELRRRSFSLACALERLGVAPGDRVAAFLPNRIEAVVAFLACASIGAIWTICAPDMGTAAILDRFRQVEPKLLIATDGALYAGKARDLTDIVLEIVAALPTLEHVVQVRSGHARGSIGATLDFEKLIARDDDEVRSFEPRWLPFDHPLWILYSSGTTGKPKAIVHGHGGILLGAAAMRLHMDLRPSYAADSEGERFHWFSSTGWMVWNAQVGGLLSGTTICLYDGSPSGPKDRTDWSILWRFVARHGISFFGSGAQFFTMCLRAGVDFSTVGGLSALRTIGSTASPLPADVQLGLSAHLRAAGYDAPWWLNSSGGTDICGVFCTGSRDLPPAPGRMQCRQLGAAVEAWSPEGKSMVGEVGELVCTRPLPSMPLYFWGDREGRRYHESYFDMYPGIWRHGDWVRIDPDGSCTIYGRSDATINRGGHRMGTSEIYQAIEGAEGVVDSLVVDVRTGDGESELLAFIVAAEGKLPQDLVVRIRESIRTSLSPRFVPDQVYFVAAIPRTLSMKKQELPIKRLFEGRSLTEIIDPSAMANPDCLSDFVNLATAFRASR
ncbi:acetoacetate--CoA ligase [Sphingomonas lycopersici]|uniref:Acetoacetate--CoA ligase n=1 Tax=Sphingomonas lycopersici TaxID=2951807 RepID=A0AA41ZCD3_9SPHN|nr:acetoacetate--CoA ligase [Sphingomonas lycopersici]MCW6536757.1 acetoacetate--CoA ligase [Sphingomonas lycopersici]